MKNAFRFFGLILLNTLLVTSLTSCGESSSSGDPATNDSEEISWTTPGFKATTKRYAQSDPDTSWTVTLSNKGTSVIDEITYVNIEIHNYDNGDNRATTQVPINIYTDLTAKTVGEFYYEMEDTDINRCVYNGIESITVQFGTVSTAKVTCWGTDFISGLAPEAHTYPDTQKWINWFHADHLFIKEEDYWVSGGITPPTIQELVGTVIQ